MKQTKEQDKKQNRESAIWPRNDSNDRDAGETGNGNSIGNDPSTSNKDKGTSKTNNSNTPAGEPEINPPIYDPETTKKKMPVMDEDFKADNQG